MTPAALDQMLLHAFDCEERRHAIPGNFSLPLKQAGLIRSWHEGWGFYGFEFTALGRTRVNELCAP